MATDLQTPPEQQTLTGIVSGIVHDVQTLLTQQMEMFRAEARSDWEKTKQAMMPLAVGAGLALMGGILWSFMLVYLLYWAVSPPGDAGIPLWGCFALIGGAFVIAGGAMLGAGFARLRSVHPLPEKSTEALKENVKWLTNSK
jgi:hypothetical protein